MSNGIVVDHKDAGVRYAISKDNFDEATMTKVRDLKPGETVIGYTPRAVESLAAVAGTNTPGDAENELSGLSELESETPAPVPQAPDTKTTSRK